MDFISTGVCPPTRVSEHDVVLGRLAPYRGSTLSAAAHRRACWLRWAPRMGSGRGNVNLHHEMRRTESMDLSSLAEHRLAGRSFDSCRQVNLHRNPMPDTGMCTPQATCTLSLTGSRSQHKIRLRPLDTEPASGCSFPTLAEVGGAKLMVRGWPTSSSSIIQSAAPGASRCSGPVPTEEQVACECEKRFSAP